MKKDKEQLKKLYRLEYLVATNGDASEIEQLRQDLKLYGVGLEFDPEHYKKLVLAGLSLPEIERELNMSKSSLYKFRVKHGLVHFGGFK